METTWMYNSIAGSPAEAVRRMQWMSPFTGCALCAVGIRKLHTGGGS